MMVMNATAASGAEPSRMTRLAMFILLALPGAWLIGTCGPLIVNAIANDADAWLCSFLLIPFVLGARLLLYGTRTTEEPLFLLVFLPMPILISLGFHLGYLEMDAGFPIAVAGVAMPAVIYGPASRYYRRRAARAKIMETMPAEAIGPSC